MENTEGTDLRVRAAVYDSAIARSKPSMARELAAELGLPLEAVKESLERLAAAKALVLQPESREVLMANPFSAVPTPFAVITANRPYYGNCIWDALGILAMLSRDGRVDTSCACCGESMSLSVKDRALQSAAGVVHFAIPARRWWEDIVFN